MFIDKKKYIVNSVLHKNSKLKVDLKDYNSKSICTVKFSNVVLVRVSDESYRLKSLDSYPLSDSNMLHQIYDNSLISWLIEECFDSYEFKHIKHFVFLDSETIIDVITYDSPTINFRE
jgi:hypothetical protein